MARDKKEDPDEPKKQEEPKKKSKLKLIIIVSIAVAVIAAGTAAGFYFFAKKESSKSQAQAQQPVVLSICPMDAFIVNIADSSAERYLKIVIQLEVSGPNVMAELEQFKPRLRDSILDLLGQKAYKELMDAAGKQRLREDIAGRVNTILTNGKVSRVYFTEFVVQ